MDSELVRIICQTGIFIICARTLVHIRPNASYEKYLKLLVSAMVLLQILRPVGAFLGRGGADLKERAEWFERQLDESMREADLTRRSAEERLERMTLEEVRRRMEEDEISWEDIEPVEEIRVSVEKGGETDEGEAEKAVEEMVP